MIIFPSTLVLQVTYIQYILKWKSPARALSGQMSEEMTQVLMRKWGHWFFNELKYLYESNQGKSSSVCGAKLLQSRLTLCDPMDCCLPGSSGYGILQAGMLEWVAKPSSRGWSSWPRDYTCVSCLLHWQTGSLPLVPPGKSFGLFRPKTHTFALNM